MKSSLSRWLFWLGACSGDEPAPQDSKPPDDSDSPVDTDVAPSDPDTPPGETDTTPRDTGRPLDLGAGFLNLSAPLYTTWPRDVFAGDRAAREQPDLTHGHFVDLDGDGWQEVVIVGTGAAPGAPRDLQALRYDRDSVMLVPDGALTRALVGLDPQLVAFADLDGDGDQDAVPGTWEQGPIEATSHGVFSTDPRYRWPVYGPGMMSVALADLDGDGWIDLAHNPKGCRPEVRTWMTLMRTDPFHWAWRPNTLADVPLGNPYVMGMAPLAGTPHVFALGQACSPADEVPGFFTLSQLDSVDRPIWDAADPTPRDARYKLRPAVAGGPITRVNPMGASLGDLDGDGDSDLAITSVHEDLLLFMDDGTLPLRDVTEELQVRLPPRVDDGSGLPHDILKPWGVVTADVDRDGANDLVVVNGDDHTDWVNDVPGLHRPLLWLNRRDHFEEHGRTAGLELPTNGRSLTVGDLDHDGRPDLIMGGYGQLPTVWLNRVDGDRQALALYLRGTSSGSPVAGAVVRVHDELIADAVVAGGSMSGGSTSEPIAFSTTGADGVAERVEIRWPSGWRQELRDVPAGYSVVVEPETLSVQPTTRRAQVGEVITVRYVPRSPDGAAREAEVAISAAAGGGVAVGDLVRVGEGWERAFVAEGAGYVIVAVVVDGVEVPVRPRLSWDGP